MSKIEEQVRQYRRNHQTFNEWASGYDVIEHSDETQVLLFDLADKLLKNDSIEGKDAFFDLLMDLDRITSAVMWLVVHMTYARNVYLHDRTMEADDFRNGERPWSEEKKRQSPSLAVSND